MTFRLTETSSTLLCKNQVFCLKAYFCVVQMLSKIRHISLTAPAQQVSCSSVSVHIQLKKKIGSHSSLTD